MKALRPPLAASPITYLVRFRCPRESAGDSAPERWRSPSRAGIIGQPAIPIAGSLPRGREWDISGFQATHPMPLLRSTTPAEPTSLASDGFVGAAPATTTAEAPAWCQYRGYRGASAPAVYASRAVLPPPHARLASGWLAGLYREGVEPSGPQ